MELQQLLAGRRLTLEKLFEVCSDCKTVSTDLGITNARQIAWHFLNQVKAVPTCKCGNKLLWNADDRQYRLYCSKKCTAIYSQEQIKKTNLERYGVEHFSQTDQFKDNCSATSFKRFGVSHYSKTEEHKTRVKKSNNTKFGYDYPMQSSVVKEQVQQSWMTKLGVSNPMQNSEIKQKQALTNFERYGGPSPLCSPAVKSQIRETMFARYGVEQPLQNEDIARKAADTRKINYYSAWAYEKLHDADWLQQQNTMGKSVAEIANELGVSGSNLCKYFHKHDLDIKRHFRSAMEKDLTDYYINLGINVVSNTRSVIFPLEIDIWFPDHNIGVELNGAYYHSERQGKSTNYHLNKTTKCNSVGATLLQFFDWELFTSKPIVIDKINHLLKLNSSVGARKLNITVLSPEISAQFFNANHLQGNCGSTIVLGLCNQSGDVLAAMSFGKSRYTKKYNWELIRYATAIGHSVAGGASRLLKHFVNHYANTGEIIVSYCNRRWSKGDLYEKLGFTFSHTAPPGYYYIEKNGKYAGTRQQWQKHKLADKLPIFDAELSEYDNMKMNDYTRVWDCGQLVYLVKVS